MELNIFMRELESALIKRGISDETARKHVSNLGRTFTSDDLSEIDAIHSRGEIEQLADSISTILNKTKRTAAPTNSSAPSPEKPKPQRTNNAVAEYKTPAKPKKVEIQALPDEPDDDDYYNEYSADVQPTTRGMVIFWVGLFLTLPLTLALAAVIFGSFAAVFIVLGALIVGLIAVLIAVAASGAGVSLVGIIFGITQLFSFAAAGIYEIGLGIMVAGAVLLVSVLIYNFAIRFLPWLISLVGNFLGFVCGKLKILFFNIRRECYKL